MCGDAAEVHPADRAILSAMVRLLPTGTAASFA
jgi:hypothetical protein